MSLITYGGTLWKTLQAADELAAEGIDAEVIDLRTLRPLDTATILDSVTRTHRAVIVDEGWRSGSISAEITARIIEGAFYDLDAPVARVCSAEVPMPYAKHLEDAALPQVPRIVAAAIAQWRAMAEFRMPSLGADMDMGTLVEWTVKPGDRVQRGDIVALVETEKGLIEVEIFEDGVIESLVAAPGEKVAGRNRAGHDRCERGAGRHGRGAAEACCGTSTGAVAASRGGPTAPRASAAARGGGASRREASGLAAGPAASRGARRRSRHGDGTGEAGDHPSSRRRARGRCPARSDRRPSKPPPAAAHCRCRGSASRSRHGRAALSSHAPGDRRRHGALEARDPALLSRDARST